MNNIEIREILERHQHWLREDCYKCEEMRANLHRANLRVADLREVNLCEADLSGADLRKADLYGANLHRANLRGADLREVNLCEADLSGADLCGANLCGANLRKADLYGADLREVNLCEADLSKANLCKANLYNANLYGVDLYKTNLRRTNLCEANNVPFIPYACPDFGAFTGFKKAHDLIVMLEIPEDAQRISATGRKCRCNKAKVLEIQNMDGTKASVTSVSSDRDNNFVYEVGKEVYVPNFNNDRWEECGTGIHFFINRQEAVNYI